MIVYGVTNLKIDVQCDSVFDADLVQEYYGDAFKDTVETTTSSDPATLEIDGESESEKESVDDDNNDDDASSNPDSIIIHI